ncbi:MAG: sel1 repeat family protein, partial [Proteobacteria bacterium]|nr:sel1 repeat family protein [Pseudomonadota bacterium]
LGNEKAMLALARMYHYGLGVTKDPKMSASIYQKLADRQNAYAQYQLGTYYIEGLSGERLPDKGKQLLKQASDNGSAEARKLLQRMEAAQGKVSFIEPVFINKVPVLTEQSPDRVYFDAMSEWNRGDEALSLMILQRLVTQFPHFVPAKNIYEQLNQAKRDTIYG